MSQPEICFFAQTTYPLLAGNASGREMGGAQLQQVLLGQELSDRGYSVSYITMDHGQGAEQEIGPFRVQATFRPDEGLPGLRFFYPRMAKVLRALRGSTADIFYFRCADHLLAPLVWEAHRRNRKVVFCAASDPNLDPGRLNLPWRRKAMFFWGLRRCDAIVVQNSEQRRLLKQNFGREGYLIHNGFASQSTANQQAKNILWVSRQLPLKQSELFLKLASRIPSHPFVMIGGSDGSAPAYYQQVKRAAESVTNLDFKGAMEFSLVEAEFDQTRVLVNTSMYEGFPNTFLQAWSRGIPVFSFVDPDGLIEKHRLGYVAGDIEDMTQMLAKYLAGKVCFSADKIRQVFEEHFTIESAVDRYELLFAKLVGLTDGRVSSPMPSGVHSA